jgi:hypothetical protein
MEEKSILDKWNMSDERKHIENIVNQRFNFFLIFFSLVVGGVATSIDHPLMIIVILGIGALICWFLWATLARAQFKLNLVIKSLPEDHPEKIIDEDVKDAPAELKAPAFVPEFFTTKSQRNLIGYTIPAICCSILTLGFLIAFIYWACGTCTSCDSCKRHHLSRCYQ